MKNVLGLIMTFDTDTGLRDLTDYRTVAAIPFGGRYRVIDFMLSNMVNSNINQVGIVLRDKYQSVIDHIGNGKDWDLGRKIGGINFLPPYSYSKKTHFFDVPERRGKVEGLIGILSYLKKSKCEQIIISSSNIITNIDLSKVVEYHKESESDITCVCNAVTDHDELRTYFKFNTDNTITDLCVSIDSYNNYNFAGLGIYVINKETLVELITEWASHNYKYFELEGLNQAMKTKTLKAYVHTAYTRVISDVKHYYDANMDLLSKDVREELFIKERPILTKVHDEQPTYYSDKVTAVNSLIADGCTLEGTVENSIIFRDVHIEKGATVRDAIIFQGGRICSGASVSNIISDKNAYLGDNKTMMGHKNYPIVISKNTAI